MTFVDAYEFPLKHPFHFKARVFNAETVHCDTGEHKLFACCDCRAEIEFAVPTYGDGWGCGVLGGVSQTNERLVQDQELILHGVCREKEQDGLLYRRFFCPVCGQPHMMVFQSREVSNGHFVTWIGGVWGIETA
ncbi:MAG: hypothetical protein RL318_1901 [Fibrobacterota bacterium]|jgi:hypothetical protein